MQNLAKYTLDLAKILQKDSKVIVNICRDCESSKSQHQLGSNTTF